MISSQKMKYYYIENRISVTRASRFGRVKTFTACNKTCNAINLKPFRLQDFYNFADRLNQTNFLFSINQANSTEDQIESTGGTKEGFQNEAR